MSIQCKTCSKTFDKVYFEDTQQADHCASIASNTGIYGMYGSRVFDGCVAEWKDGKPEHVVNGVICDSCITSLSDKYSVVRENNFL